MGIGSGQQDRYGGKGAVDENSVKEGNGKVGIGRNIVWLGSGGHGEKRLLISAVSCEFQVTKFVGDRRCKREKLWSG